MAVEDVVERRTVSRRGSEKMKHRGYWFRLMAPTMLAIAATLAINVASYIWFMATMSSRQTNQELRLKVAEETLQHLSDHYVPREESATNDALLKEERDDEKRRLDRIEGKMDMLLERGR